MKPQPKPVRLIHVATVGETLRAFFRGQIGYLRERGIDVHAVSSPGESAEAFSKEEKVPVYGIRMHRRITPLQDLSAVSALCRLLRELRPTIVHTHTPKGGLLGMIAAWICRVPVRIYHIHGLPYVTASGARRRLMRATESVSCRLAHRVLSVSQSMRRLAIDDRICPADKIVVIGGGSFNGVDGAERFNPARQSRAASRRRLGIPVEAPVLCFVGRVVRDKGVVELVDAWRTLRSEFPNAHLLVAGPFEPQDPLPAVTESCLRDDERVRVLGQFEDIAAVYAAADVVVLPTYREGLPYVPMEAAAMEVPVVATNIPGCVDAVVDGVTGTLVPPRDASALVEAIRRYLLDPDLRCAHGRAGRERVLREFRQEAIWQGLYNEYCRLLAERGLPAPKPAAEASVAVS